MPLAVAAAETNNQLEEGEEEGEEEDLEQVGEVWKNGNSGISGGSGKMGDRDTLSQCFINIVKIK